ncbi:glycosyl hydrolase catalytic core-domain-containing protein [Tribonema minus]|uniref:Glycosyl hydrolase catalytic core-domain-containing protein n=1 Tax=Tribonema minus TaxID=303371 RepID=A0A836CAM7_9STRA|nr:glycosyl hydrolase catalytic core-domain-containing protein [Tribonema minus]
MLRVPQARRRHRHGHLPQSLLNVVLHTYLTPADPPRCYTSPKRGVAIGMAISHPEDLQALAPGVTWFNNWAIFTNIPPHLRPSITFFPLTWGAKGVRALSADTMAEPGGVLVGFNEPNWHRVEPEFAAEMWGEVIAAAKKYNGKVSEMGVKARRDAVLGITWMRDFIAACERLYGTAAIDYINIHSYTCSTHALDFNIREHVRAFPGKKIIITEIACGQAMRNGHPRQQLSFMKQVIPYLENSEDVVYYSWYNGPRPTARKPAPHGAPTLFGLEPGQLTPLGREYRKRVCV